MSEWNLSVQVRVCKKAMGIIAAGALLLLLSAAPAMAATPDEVARIVKLANELRIPITPWGGGSGVQGAANADQGAGR